MGFDFSLFILQMWIDKIITSALAGKCEILLMRPMRVISERVSEDYCDIPFTNGRVMIFIFRGFYNREICFPRPLPSHAAAVANYSSFQKLFVEAVFYLFFGAGSIHGALSWQTASQGICEGPEG